MRTAILAGVLVLVVVWAASGVFDIAATAGSISQAARIAESSAGQFRARPSGRISRLVAYRRPARDFCDPIAHLHGGPCRGHADHGHDSDCPGAVRHRLRRSVPVPRPIRSFRSCSRWSRFLSACLCSWAFASWFSTGGRGSPHGPAPLTWRGRTPPMSSSPICFRLRLLRSAALVFTIAFGAVSVALGLSRGDADGCSVVWRGCLVNRVGWRVRAGRCGYGVHGARAGMAVGDLDGLLASRFRLRDSELGHRAGLGARLI